MLSLPGLPTFNLRKAGFLRILKKKDAAGVKKGEAGMQRNEDYN